MMDSFYSAPRQPPSIPTINSIERIPMVPEVSVFENCTFAPSKTSRPCDYNNHSDQSLHGSSFISKKHVRFKNSCPEMSCDKENVPQNIKSVPDLNGKTFRQIYMANVPDRHLDLSIFEPPRPENLTKTHETFSDKNLRSSPLKSTTNIATWKARDNVHCSPPNCTEISLKSYTPSKTRENTRICNPSPLPKCTEIAEVTPASDEPTIRDLYNIIQQQNEQIMMLQRQVNNLKTTIRQPEINSAPCDTDKLTNSPKKGMFSFDVKATSFEFSFRPPQQKLWRQNEFLEPKIQEIMECDTTNGNSLQLEGSLNVGNSYVSDVPSIEIKMDDYHSSEEDEELQPKIGLTFYKDLMEQVNKVLKRVQKQSECQKPDITGQNMKAVKQATLQHLQNIGVNLTPIQESSEVSSELDINNQSEVSCAVQQLLMKYLPEDKLVKAVRKPKLQSEKPKERKMKPSPSTEFSFATLQYMKKYNIDCGNKRGAQVTPKILDVTALKLQPKLL